MKLPTKGPFNENQQPYNSSGIISVQGTSLLDFNCYFLHIGQTGSGETKNKQAN